MYKILWLYLAVLYCKKLRKLSTTLWFLHKIMSLTSFKLTSILSNTPRLIFITKSVHINMVMRIYSSKCYFETSFYNAMAWFSNMTRCLGFTARFIWMTAQIGEMGEGKHLIKNILKILHFRFYRENYIYLVIYYKFIILIYFP